MEDEETNENEDESPSKSALAGPSGRRKSNFNNAEVKFLVDQYMEHKKDMEGLVELTGNRLEKSEAWESIHRKYVERWPDKGRSIRDLRRKLSKLKSETRHIYKKEKLKRHGKGTSDEIPPYIWGRNVQKSHKIMLSALQSDFEDSDPEAEYVEYELEFDDHEVAGTDDENDDNDGDDGGGDGDDDAADPERIFQKLLTSKSTPIRTRSKSKEESEPATKKRKRDSQGKTKEQKSKELKTKEPEKPKTREEEILDLQKEKLEIERDNLLLVQRKLQLEVALLEKRLQDTSGSNGGSGTKIHSGSSSSTVAGEVVEIIGTDGATETVTVAGDE